MRRRRRFYFPITRTLVLLIIMLVLMACASWMLVEHIKYLFASHNDLQNRTVLTLAANIVDGHINATLAHLQGLAYLSSVSAAGKDGAIRDEWLDRMRIEAKKIGFRRISISDFEGNTISTTGRQFNISNIAEQEQFQKTIYGFSSVSGVVTDRITDTRDTQGEVIIFQVPVFKGAVVTGALSGAIGLEDASSFLAGIDTNYSGNSLFIIDGSNRIITYSKILTDRNIHYRHSISFFDYMSNIIAPEEQGYILKNLGGLQAKNIYMYVTKKDQHYFSFTPLSGSSGWKLVEVSSEEGIISTQRNIIYRTGLLILAVTLSIIVSLLCLYIISWKYYKIRALNRTTLEKSGFHLFMLSPEGIAEDFDEGFAKLLGIPEHSFSFDFRELMDKDQTIFPQNSIRMGQSFRLPLHMADGRTIYLLIQVIGNEEGGFYQSFAVDVTKDELIQEHIRMIAYTDLITMLPNRESFSLKVEELGRRCLRESFNSAYLFININDTHKILEIFGDRVARNMLLEAANRLSSVAKECGGLLYNLGNDNFVILLESFSETQELKYICSKIKDLFLRPFVVFDNKFEISCRVGAVPCPEYLRQTPISPSDMFRYGEITMRLAKNPDNMFILNAKTYKSIMKELDIERDLAQSIIKNELELYYQPIYDSINDRIYSVEALLRWHSVRHGDILPKTFIPMAEKSGFINQLGDFVIDSAMAFASQLKDKDVKVQFNVSTIQLMQSDFADRLLAKFRKHCLSHFSVGMEITEACFLENAPGTREKLGRLRACGIMVFIDDFGTGYSSFSYLKDMPADCLKIDKTFVGGLETSNKQKTIIKAISYMADALGMLAIAEGVETKEQLDLVLQSGCRYVQGFLIAKPMPAKDVIDFINGFNSED